MLFHGFKGVPMIPNMEGSTLWTGRVVWEKRTELEVGETGNQGIDFSV
jgi:hypothetical protein